MNSNESEPMAKKSFIPRWVVAGLSAAAFTSILAGCGDENSSKTYVSIPEGTRQLGMNFVGSPGLKFQVPAGQDEQIDCGYRTYFHVASDRVFGAPEYVPNPKAVEKAYEGYSIVVCQGTSRDTVVAWSR